jgi:AGCS family alanine or glycine:cation symporter
MDFVGLINTIVGYLWGPPLLLLLLGSGIYFTIRSKFWQFAHLGYAIKQIANSLKPKDDNSGMLSSFEAVATALGSAVGVGNIAGVASAIALGGPGALFWMWISALVGMATKMVEITLALHYREKNKNGDAFGGPTYYMEKGFKEKKYIGWKVLASVFGFGILSDYFLGMSAYTVSEAVSSVFGINQIMVAAVFAIALTAVVLGGIKRLGKVLAIVVPIMCIAYLIAGITIILKDVASLPSTFSLIFQSAFKPSAAIGGFAGASVALAFRTGLARGVYSNEAGWGTAAMIHSTAKVDHPVEQGVMGVVEVFIDSIIVCTVTGLVIINTGAWSSGLTAAPLAIKAFEIGLGSVGPMILVLAIFLLGWTSVTAKYTNYEIVLRHTFGVNEKTLKIILMLFRCCVAIPGLMLTLIKVKFDISSSVIWLFADLVTGLPTLVNIIALLMLSGKFFELLKDYNDKNFGRLKGNKEKSSVKLFYEDKDVI